VSSPAARAQPAAAHRARRLIGRARGLVGRLRRAVKYEVHAFWRSRPIKQNVVFYESFAGNGMLCNPEAIFRALRQSREFEALTHVWVLRSKRENPTVVREFRRDRSVQFVRPRSIGYYRALATSRYLINNATFPPEFGKRPGQVYLNTWHGTPLKKMGFDIGDPASRVGNVIRNFVNADYLLAANDFMRVQMYDSAHKLEHLYRGKIIVEGYPRMDRQVMEAVDVAATRKRLESAGITLGDRKVILYAPTWKGTSFNRPEDDAEELIRRIEQLDALIDTSKYVVLLKTHQVVHTFAAHLPALRGRLVPNEIPTNVILGVTDILVSDYSSIFFDFLATGRPIVFFTPDLDEYGDYRGLYMPPETWPGAVARTIDEAASAIAGLDTTGQSAEVAARYEAMRHAYTSLDDGNATERIIDIVFRGHESGYDIRQFDQGDERTSLLINAGGMRPNGITSSLVNLVDAIDHDRYDVSVVFNTSYRRLVIDKQRELNPRVRQFSRVGGMNGSKLAHFGRRRSWTAANLRTHDSNPVQRRLWDDEWLRCFGSSRFDVVIDFSGYGPFWATLLLHAPGAFRAIWMHNDLAADAHRVTKGKRSQLRDLSGIFTLYGEYDRLVSVSPSLSEINRKELSGYAPGEKFVSSVNLVNADRTLRHATEDPSETLRDAESGELPEWVHALYEPDAGPTFVTVGRLSAEKNQARLIRAFAKTLVTHPRARLFIVGDGPLRAQLESLAASLHLNDSLWFTGHQPNPHAIMARSNCFVLSSNYEGQPMVLLEAMVLGLPVVTVDFGSARDALPQGAALIVGATDADLAAAMMRFLDQGIDRVRFDAAQYNKGALEQFDAAIAQRQG
jgi:CDP-glycerol glycerophosphotransferase (TagB/SpsB family)/glycosyltransferase involved in cell wall biosynthesis